MSSPVAEARWPSAGAVVAVMVLTVLMPDELRVAPTWLLLVLEAALLLALIVADPGRIDRHSDRLRLAAIALVTVLVLSSLVATYLLIGDLIHGGEETNSATDLLEAGAFVWVSNNIAFALLYWELDGGGSAARTRDWPHRTVDLAFPQDLNPHVAGEAWLPRFIDYLYLGFTNATAFSPTDTMPLVPWAKIAMTIQSLVSLAILGLVVARAVNVFT
jgi:uncharacterized membrane protein